MLDLKAKIIDDNINNVLIAGDINYYENSDVEVEMISDKKIECLRLIKPEQFINKDKRLIYYKYKNIIIEQDYLGLITELKYYFEDHDLNLWIILPRDYLIEKNALLINLLEDKKYHIDLIEYKENLLMRVKNG